jgi:hypothetical protein
VDARLDHLVYAVPDLAEGTAFVADALGVRPTAGGQHVGRGTANTLVGLGDGAYLEIIGPDLTQPPPALPRPFAIDDLIAPVLVTWAARVSDLPAVIVAARAAGYDPGPAQAMQRATPEGGLLAWSLTAPPGAFDGLVPFLIDWGDSPHPSGSLAHDVRLAGFVLRTPEPGPVRRALAALGLGAVGVEEAPVTSIGVTLAGPGGTLRFGR